MKAHEVNNHAIEVGDKVWCIDAYTAKCYKNQVYTVSGIRDEWLSFVEEDVHTEHYAAYWRKIGRHENR